MDGSGDDGIGTGNGRVVVATRVIEKTAAQLAAEMSGISGQGRGFLGFGGRADASARPRVSAQVAGDTAALHVRLSLGFPARIDRAVRSVQHTLTAEVARLTGVRVSRVDVDVVALLVTDPGCADELDAESDR
jgi:uncharacterized alkaline shock family protein YloU